MRRLLIHIFRVALALGIILGIILFSGLLYLSDFGEAKLVKPPETPAAAPAEEAPAPDPMPVSLQWLQWVFGPPKNPLPPAAQEAPQADSPQAAPVPSPTQWF